MNWYKRSNTDINQVLSLPKEEFSKHKNLVWDWLNQNYSPFATIVLKTRQHGGESLLNHVLNMMMHLNTDGLDSNEIFQLRIAIIHHDIDKLYDGKKYDKKSQHAKEIWQKHIDDSLNSQNINRDLSTQLIENHDVLGYFMKTYKRLKSQGVSDKEILDRWLSKHPQLNDPKILDFIRRINVSDNMGAGGLKEETKQKRKEDLLSLHNLLDSNLQ